MCKSSHLLPLFDTYYLHGKVKEKERIKAFCIIGVNHSFHFYYCKDATDNRRKGRTYL